MEFLVRIVADARACEADLRRIMKRSPTLSEGFAITAAAILPEGLGCEIEIIEEAE